MKCSENYFLYIYVYLCIVCFCVLFFVYYFCVFIVHPQLS